MLIKLSHPAALNSYVQTVALPSRCPVADEGCMVSGWGNTITSGTAMPDRLQCLRQPIIDDRICKNAYPHLMTENMLCSGFMHGGASSWVTLADLWWAMASCRVWSPGAMSVLWWTTPVSTPACAVTTAGSRVS